MFTFVVLVSVSSLLAKVLAGKSISKMCRVCCKTLTQFNLPADSISTVLYEGHLVIPGLFFLLSTQWMLKTKIISKLYHHYYMSLTVVLFFNIMLTS